MNLARKPTFIQNGFRKNGKFNRGSRLVLGTSGLGGVWGEVDEQESIDALLYALEQGIDVIDTSPSYNNAQAYVGKALRKWDGIHPFISTKIGRLPAEKADEVYLEYSPGGMKKSMEESLNLLGVDYIDLLFLHEPHLVPLKKIDSILNTLESFKQEGIVGMLGIGGNPEGEFWDYVDSNYFDVVSTFLKMDASTLEGFAHDIPTFIDEGLAIYAASSLHMGLLGSRFQEFVDDPPDTEWIRQDHIDNAIMVNEVAQKNGMSLTELALRYLFSIKEADRVVLGPTNLEELKKSINNWQEGPLNKQVFEEVTEVLLKSID
ncbi:aldo/keto reductase [Aliifodinibius sp. S!AR15-10]|uniref:aldo/keto reductase n=1 Tax=Aliifodinibius sp. S!AR15-10 TaxID=2950437 RepID=UPI00285E2D87|nr:aldo/keto reductase [Aliifodinibius sp. S!AR15-10]MDR8393804.1 aldo/keto reductase [Aliifodinibius sp. S!AR15-10]